jgi:hypothetical protein
MRVSPGTRGRQLRWSKPRQAERTMSCERAIYNESIRTRERAKEYEGTI